MMTEVKVKTEVPDDYIEEVIWQDDTKDSKKNIKDGPGDVPAEICVVIGGVRNQQTLDGKAVERGSPVGYTRNRYSGTWIFDHALRYTSGSYECGICGKKYKYYNCFQTHTPKLPQGKEPHKAVPLWLRKGRRSLSPELSLCCPGWNPQKQTILGTRVTFVGKNINTIAASKSTETYMPVEGAPENRADPYDQAVIAADDVKEEEPEPFQKIGPKTGNYTCEFCGKQYKYYTPYQEHVALHAPISEYLLQGWHLQGLWGAPGCQERLHSWGSLHWSWSSGQGSCQQTAQHCALHSQHRGKALMSQCNSVQNLTKHVERHFRYLLDLNTLKVCREVLYS
ncbi:hypothetical protein IHE44_0007066 [Lamprotornis superbus]|uniref:C2H2-type domain-containing protein n=1 Tax=Lamprotornis superbus TaxID=245042 RepID=A0A835TTI3_9PASS|nr:hypothetical protein IHE44_0007066 [Lamprotornis superbus]